MDECRFIGFVVSIWRHGWGKMVWTVLRVFGERMGVVEGVFLCGKVCAGCNKGFVMGVAGAILEAVGVGEVVEGV